MYILASIARSSALAVVQLLVQIVAVVLIARLIGPAEYGIATVALALAAFCQIVSEIGLAHSLIRRSRVTTTDVSTAFIGSCLLALLVFALLIALRHNIASWLSLPRLSDHLPLVAAGALARGYSATFEAIAYRHYKFGTLAIIELTAVVVGYGLGYWAARADAGAQSVVLAFAVQQFVRALLIRAAARFRVVASFSITSFNHLMAFGTWFSAARLLNYIATQADNIIVAKMLGPVAAGYYGRVFQVLVTPATAVAQVTSNILFPYFSRKQQDPDALLDGFLTATRGISVITIPPCVFVVVHAEALVLTVFGAEWLGMVVPLRILSLALPLRAAYKAADPVFKALGAMRIRAAIQFTYAAMVITGAMIGATISLPCVAVLIATAISAHFLLSLTAILYLLPRPHGEFLPPVLEVLRFLVVSAAVCISLALLFDDRVGGAIVSGLAAVMLAYVSLVISPRFVAGPLTERDVLAAALLFRPKKR